MEGGGAVGLALGGSGLAVAIHLRAIGQMLSVYDLVHHLVDSVRNAHITWWTVLGMLTLEGSGIGGTRGAPLKPEYRTLALQQRAHRAPNTSTERTGLDHTRCSDSQTLGFTVRPVRK